MQTCNRCGAEARLVKPSRLRWLALGAYWAVILLIGASFAVLMGLNLILVPCWFLAATSIGPAARQMLDPRCASCDSIANYALVPAAAGASSAAGATYVAGSASRPADERAVKGALIREAKDQRHLGDRVGRVDEVGHREISS